MPETPRDRPSDGQEDPPEGSSPSADTPEPEGSTQHPIVRSQSLLSRQHLSTLTGETRRIPLDRAGLPVVQ
jgi:hypothetical protein